MQLQPQTLLLKGAGAEQPARAVRSAVGSRQPRSTGDAASATDKAPGRPHTVAQKLLAKANCFAALAASPPKGDASLQVQHAASQSASASSAGKAAVAAPAQALLFSTATRDAAAPGCSTEKAASAAEASRPASAMQTKESPDSKETQQLVPLPQSCPVRKKAARKQLLADPVLTEESCGCSDSSQAPACRRSLCWEKVTRQIEPLSSRHAQQSHSGLSCQLGQGTDGASREQIGDPFEGPIRGARGSQL